MIRWKDSLQIFTVMVGGGILIALATHHGVAVSPDVAYYVGGARGILSEGRYILPTFHGTPILNYPPLTSLILAAGAWITNRDLFSVGRGMDVVFFALSTGIIWVAVRYLTGSAIAAQSGALLFAFSNDLIAVHLRIWSEPAFISASLGGLFFLSKFFTEGQKKELYIASFFFTLAFMSRYIGITLLMSGGLCVLIVGQASLRERILNGIRLCLIPTLVFGGWMIRNRILSGQSTDRTYHPGYITWDRVMIYLDQAAGAWFLPVQFPSWFRAGLFLGVCGFLVFAATRVRPRSWAPFLVFPIIFYAFLNITQVITGDGYPDDFAPEYRRYFATIHGPFLIGAIALGCAYFRRVSVRRYAKYAASGAVVLLVLLTIGRGGTWVYQAYRDGHDGGTVDVIQQLPVSLKLAALPKDVPVYFIGGHNEHLNILAFHRSRIIPGTESPHQSVESLDAADIQEVHEALKDPRALIIFGLNPKSAEELVKDYPILSELKISVR